MQNFFALEQGHTVAMKTTDAHASLAHLYGHIHHKHCPCPKTVTLQTVSSTLAAPSIHHGPVAAGTTRGAEYGQHRCLWHGWQRCRHNATRILETCKSRQEINSSAILFDYGLVHNH